MKVGLLSDSHLLSESWLDHIDSMLPSNQVDVMVLLGDIGSHGFIPDVCIYVQEKLKCDVIFVPGNHDYYSYLYYVMTKKSIEQLWRKKTKHNSKIHILIDKSVTINGVDFFGSTWWSGLGGDEHAEEFAKVSKSFSDFRFIITSIGYESGYFRTKYFDPDEMIKLNKKAIRAYKKWRINSKSEKRVLCAHFPMLDFMRNPNFKDSYYFNGVDDKVLLAHPPDYILFGHIHWNLESIEKGIYCASNMHGLKGEVGNIGFNKEFLIDI